MTAYGRRVASKTFIILGASTPISAVAPQGPRVKRNVMVKPSGFKGSNAVVSEMHNDASPAWCLIVLVKCHS
jgi:hypothetical protein